MRKKIIFCVLFTLSSLFFISAWASEEALNEAGKLLEDLGMQEIFEKSIDQNLEFQLQQNPDLLPYVGVMKNFLAKHMSYESLKNDMINLYSTTFTVQELKEIRAFYSTETGKKTLQKLPELGRISNQLGNQRVQENISELHQALENAAKLVEDSKKL
jgi:hypothetical protein